jgi:hypothetical protein
MDASSFRLHPSSFIFWLGNEFREIFKSAGKSLDARQIPVTLLGAALSTAQVLSAVRHNDVVDCQRWFPR